MFKRLIVLAILVLCNVAPSYASSEQQEQTSFYLSGVLKQQVQNNCLQMAKQVLHIRIYNRLSQEVQPDFKSSMHQDKKRIRAIYAIPELSARAFSLPKEAQFQCDYYVRDLGRMQLIEFGVVGKDKSLMHEMQKFY